jgi:peptidoglycan LD-endopeptidase LytH
MSLSKSSKKIRRFLLLFTLVITAGLLLPQHFVMPVKGASLSSYQQNSFWFYPWGKSVTHKGVDIFAKAGTGIYASTYGLVVYSGRNRIGGNVVMILGPKWRLHYYAHLKDIHTSRFSFVNNYDRIGTVGATGTIPSKACFLISGKQIIARKVGKKCFTSIPYPI